MWMKSHSAFIGLIFYSSPLVISIVLLCIVSHFLNYSPGAQDWTQYTRQELTDQSRINKTITLCDLETVQLHHKFVFAFFSTTAQSRLISNVQSTTIPRSFLQIPLSHSSFYTCMIGFSLQVQSCAFPSIKFHSVIFCPLF